MTSSLIIQLFFFCLITMFCSLWERYLFHSEDISRTIFQLKVETEFLVGKSGAFVLGITFESSPFP